MAAYPKLVSIAFDVVENLIEEWEQNPSLWQSETDLHVELSSRLTAIYRNIGYGRRVVEKVSGTGQKLIRIVQNEPTIYYKYDDGEEYWCKPDIVVLGEHESISDKATRIHDIPVLWACELKYKYRDRGDWDQKKLEYLVNQNRIAFGCWIRFHRQAKEDDADGWDKIGKGQRLWVRHAYRKPGTEI